MTGAIVDQIEPVTLIGCGTVKKSVLNRAIVHAPYVVAADGAAQVALKHGITPGAVIGDFDSVGADVRAVIAPENLHAITEQDSTDFDKCLRNIRAPLVVGVGFTGGRVDHQLATYHAMLRHADRPCLLLDKKDAVFLAPPDLTLDLPRGSRFSVFPLRPLTARSEGLRWPLDGIGFGPGERIGTSNEVTGTVRMQVSDPGMLVILPARVFERAALALGAPGAVRWPSRSA